MLVETTSVSDLIRKQSLTATEQKQIEDAITQLADDRHCTRDRAAQLLNREAFPEMRF